jgi:hypothetical protein
MKPLTKALLGLGAALGAWAQAQVHPGFTLTSVNFTPGNLFTPSQGGNRALPLVGDFDIFPDGRVAIAEWGVPGSVFIVSGLNTGANPAQVTRFAKGLDNVMGIAIADNTVYVMEKEALTQLVDVNGDGTADDYNSVNQAFPSDNSMLNFPYDMEYMNGAFYTALSSDVHTGGYDWGSSRWNNTSLPGRSTLYRLNLDGTSQAIACGFRNPNGMAVNGADIFTTDNQGSWLPSSKVIHIKQGRFYGHQTIPENPCQTANNDSESPPVVWNNWDNNETGRSSGNPVVLKQGRFAGQILVPDLVVGRQNPVFRVFVENVGGELQGCILPFIKSGTQTGVHRIKEAANGNLYLGMLGSNGGWNYRSGMVPGFQVLRDNGNAVFEIKAVRSLGNQNFELEFTKPVGNAAGQTGTYTVTKWRQVPQENYGGGNNSNNTSLSVQSATISPDRLKVNLQIGNLTAGWVVKFAFSGLSAQDGSSLFTHFAVYTLNRFGPGTDYRPATTPVASQRSSAPDWKLIPGNGRHRLLFSGSGIRRMAAVYALSGAKVLEARTDTPELVLETGTLAKGLYHVLVQEGNRKPARPAQLVVP